MTEILPSDRIPPGSISAGEKTRLRQEILKYKGVTQIARKQRPTGVWASNMLGLAPSKAQGITGVGTVASFRRLVEMGVRRDDRTLRLASRVFFRLISRDEDPKLQFEFQKAAKIHPEYGAWGRQLMMQGASCALAEAGLIEDPRVRGAAQRLASDVSQFLRGDLSDSPIIKKNSRNVLHPDATPPTVFFVSMLAHMPNMQRERAGLLERLTQFITKPEPRKTYVVAVGKKIIKPTVHLLGDPLHLDSAGRPKDFSFALHWLELLARLDAMDASNSGQRALHRLLKDCDQNGVWSPKNLRALPKSPSRLADFAFPLEVEMKSADARRADVTFRLALIAKLLGWDLQMV